MNTNSAEPNIAFARIVICSYPHKKFEIEHVLVDVLEKSDCVHYDVVITISRTTIHLSDEYFSYAKC